MKYGNSGYPRLWIIFLDMHLLEVKNLVKSFGGRKVVNDASLTVGEAEVIGLLGPNGAGKTTIFRMVIGMLRPDCGNVMFRNEDVTRMPMYMRAQRGMGYLSQEPSVFQGMRVAENILSVLEARGIKGKEARITTDALLDRFGLSGLRFQKAYCLSGGERRKLEIARALSLKPALLLLDEPFSGIDPKSVSEIQDLISDLRGEGISILLTDHNVRETLSVTDRSYIIDNGRILAQGLPADIVNNELVRRAYLGEKFTM